MKRIIELRGASKQWKGGVEQRQREERRGHTHPIRAQQTAVHPEPGGTEGFALSQQDRVHWFRSFRQPRSQSGETCQRGTTSTHDHRAAGKGKTSLLWFSLSFKLALRTHSHSFSLTHADTLPHYLACEWGYFSLSRAETSVLFLHSCNVAPAAVFKGRWRQTGAFLRGVSFRDRPIKPSGTSQPWRTLSPVLPPPFPRSSAAKDSWCKLVSTWELSYWDQKICFARLCQFAGLGVVNMKWTGLSWVLAYALWKPCW